MADPFLLFAQHGWDDDSTAIASLARQLLSPRGRLVAPSLNRLQTWMRLEPLIQAVERYAAEEAARAPELPWRIIGHSMGGLIWLEVLA
ncbi:MAG: lysophospholipase, partial [Cyanobacteria bacterium J06641_5]